MDSRDEVPVMCEKNFSGFTCLDAICTVLEKHKPKDIKEVLFHGNNDDREIWLTIKIKGGKTFKITATEED